MTKVQIEKTYKTDKPTMKMINQKKEGTDSKYKK